MDKKTIYIIIAVIAVLVVAVCVIFAVSGGKNQTTNTNQGTTTSQLNVQEASSKIANNTPFNEMATMDITADIAESMYQLTSNDIEEISGKMPMMNVHASMYVIIKAKDGKIDTVKTKMEEYATNYEQQWSKYLPDQYELVQARKTGVVGNCYYMIIAENAAELEKLVK